MAYISAKLRQAVAQRARGRCEYCRLHETHAFFTHEVDHIYAEKHGGLTEEDNLCVACADCNRHKGSDICSIDPVTRDIVPLFHPRQAKWTDHFHLAPSGVIEPLTATGRVTERVLRFNRVELIVERARLMAAGGYNELEA
jgi:hypothetical protein